jgi:hypothetical protein
MRFPTELSIFRQSWIYFLGLVITIAVILTWYHLDPSTPRIVSQ